MRADDEAEFAAFVRSRSGQLRGTAWLLTGDWAAADDLVQAALVKTWQRWTSIRRRDAAEAYTRRVMARTYAGWRRRRWVGELALGWLPDRAQEADVAGELADRDALLAALERLPRQQRAVIVLRYFCDLSERDTADALGCSVGAVKTHASRALRTLRADRALQESMPVREQ